MERLIRSLAMAALLCSAAIAYTAAEAFAGGDNALRMTLEAPRMEAPVQGAAEGGDSALQVRVGAVENPSLTPFGIIVRLPDGREIGRFALFPADRTGDYYLSLRPEEQAALSEDGRVILEIDPTGGEEEPLAITVDFVRLR